MFYVWMSLMIIAMAGLGISTGLAFMYAIYS